MSMSSNATGCQPCKELDDYEANARYLLDRCPHTIRVREGGGPEDLMQSLVVTFRAMEQKSAQPEPAEGGQAPTLTPVEHGALSGLIAVAAAAWRLADDTEDNGKTLTVDRGDFDNLSVALDKLEELPDDQPGYTMGAAGKAEWALRRMLTAAGLYVGPTPDERI
jgi:hypothetical protein